MAFPGELRPRCGGAAAPVSSEELCGRSAVAAMLPFSGEELYRSSTHGTACSRTVDPTRRRGHDGFMTNPKQTLTPSEISAAGLAGWHQVDGTITAQFSTGDFATGLDLVNRIGASAEAADHHPDLTLTYPSVGVTLSSHDVGGITSRDVDLARLISEHAATLGAPVDES